MGLLLACTRKGKLILFKNNPNPLKYSSKNTIIITAGGTGGHMHPAESLFGSLIKLAEHYLISDLRGSNFLNTFPNNIKVYTQNVISLNFKNPFFIYSIYLLIKGIFIRLFTFII